MVTPLTLPPDPPRPVWPWLVLALIAALGLVGMIAVTRSTPVVPRAPEPRLEFVSPAATFPRELIAAAEAQMTALAPTPWPTPEPTTPVPAGDIADMIHRDCVAGIGLQPGEVCEWPGPTPAPSPTPPPCGTPQPFRACVWGGEP